MPEDEKVETTNTDPKDETTEDQEQKNEKGDGDKKPENVDNLRADLASANARIAELNRESADRRRKLDKYEKDEKTRKEAEMSDLEKANGRVSELETAVSQRDAALRTIRIQTATERTASKMKFRDPGDVYRMLKDEISEVEIDEQGNSKEIDDKVKNLARVKPYLLDNSKESPDIDSKTDSSKKKEIDDKALRSRFGL